MIKPEQIPNEVVEAAAYKYLFYCPRLKTHDEAIRAAIAAALNAWPEACKSESGVRWRWWIELPIEDAE